MAKQEKAKLAKVKKETKSAPKKLADKKPETKTAKPKITEKKAVKQIEGKAVGRNVILIIEGHKYSKTIAEKEERQAVLDKVLNYNKKPSTKLEKEIISIMLENKTTEKERKAKVIEEIETKKIEEIKEQPAPEVVKSTEAEIAAAKKLLEENGHTVSKVAPIPQRRRGEY